MDREKITINGKVYSLIKKREHSAVFVYKGENSFLRLGPEEILKPELNLHKNLIQYGFPVSKIINEGSANGLFFYEEISLGDDLLGDLFFEDFKKDGRISDNHFNDILKISLKFAEAQIKTIGQTRNIESFYLGVHIDLIQEELPHLKNQIILAFEKVKQHTKDIPYVLTHGDFNAFNIFKNGVIDFGSSFEAPFGYDLVCNISHAYFFPGRGDYERIRRYEFTNDQIAKYFKKVDDLFVSNNLPKLSDFIDDFTFCRAVWATVNMSRIPKEQKWRYDKFEKMLTDYLENRSIFEKHIGQ